MAFTNYRAWALCGLLLAGAGVQAQDATESAGAGQTGSGADAQQTQVPPPAAEPSVDYGLAAVLESMRAAAEVSREELAARESRYQQKLEQSRARLKATQERLAATEELGRRLERRFDNNKVELNDKAELLKEKIGQLKELFGVFQQNASDLIGAFNGSATSIEYPDRDIWLEGFANRMKNASEVTSADDIKTLWFEVMREIDARGRIVRLQAPVHAGDGSIDTREIIRVGGFDLITAEPAPAYLQWRAGRQQVHTMPRQPQGPFAAQIQEYASARDDMNMLSVDPTGGVLVTLLAEKPTTQERADQGGLVGYMIIGLGAVACLLAVLKLLDISLVSLRVSAQRRALDAPRDNNSLGRLLLAYQRFVKADAETLEMRLHDCVAKESGRIRRFTIFLAIIAAVAPLMGLLGTVVGMINTFQAITLYGTGDPQTMAGGISQALITTVLGLVVAVPAVLLNALVSARASAVINVLKQQMALLLGRRLQIQAEATKQPPGIQMRPGDSALLVGQE